jgi:hypothetical protein
MDDLDVVIVADAKPLFLRLSNRFSSKLHHGARIMGDGFNAGEGVVTGSDSR